jgi:hypothetical protein
LKAIGIRQRRPQISSAAGPAAAWASRIGQQLADRPRLAVEAAADILDPPLRAVADQVVADHAVGGFVARLAAGQRHCQRRTRGLLLLHRDLDVGILRIAHRIEIDRRLDAVGYFRLGLVSQRRKGFRQIFRTAFLIGEIAATTPRLLVELGQ